MTTDNIAAPPERKPGQVSMVNVGTLFSHPLNHKIYGEGAVDKSFLVSVRELGPIEPVVIAKLPALDGGGGIKTYVLSGHRRFLAAKELGWKTIPAREADVDANDPAAVERYLIESNRQRVKNWEQKGREVKELQRIESQLARQRMLSGKAVNSEDNPKANLPEGSKRPKGQARDIAAEQLGVGATTARKIIKIIEAVDTGSTKARRLLDAVNAGEKSPDRAYQELVPTKAKSNA